MSKQIVYPTWSDLLEARVTKNVNQIKEWFFTLPGFSDGSDDEEKWVRVSEMYYLGIDPEIM